MKTMLLLVNPCAGQRKGRRYLADIIALYNRNGYHVMTHLTDHAGDCEQIAMELAGQVDLVVCCGGDGTFNETASGVLKSGADVPIGYIPAGSTNDFAASLQLSTNIMQAARDVIEGTPMYVDMGTFAGRFFSYVASFGIFTRASYLTPQNAKNLLGHAAYVLGGIQELSQLRTWHMRFLLPDGTEIEDEFVFGAISNSTSVGGVLTLAKERVDLCDGKLELLLIRAPKDLKELAECVLALQRQTYDSTMLTFRNTSSVQIHAQPEMDWTLDGEHEPGHEQVQVQCVHKAIRIICKH
ncbi:MAG: YegS/Rv2252/BmrU family lipid kinase [Oscillospiraceae bacterium]|nr:YegS/Rv2252/BmrU family lipid kinase [Oscillospiraceae bacterium]